jgi:mannose-1-phosphate guanylyltransferase
MLHPPLPEKIWFYPIDKASNTATFKRACLTAGCLWNTLAIVAKLSTLLDLGQRLLPDLTTRMARAASHMAAGRALAIEQDYGLTQKADFSRMILEACLPLLAVFTPPELTWSDLGTPPRVRRTPEMVASNGAA